MKLVSLVAAAMVATALPASAQNISPEADNIFRRAYYGCSALVLREHVDQLSASDADISDRELERRVIRCVMGRAIIDTELADALDEITRGINGPPPAIDLRPSSPLGPSTSS